MEPFSLPSNRWQPAMNEIYFSIYRDANNKRTVRRQLWTNHPVDVIHRSSGNCFKTLEEAEYLNEREQISQ